MEETEKETQLPNVIGVSLLLDINVVMVLINELLSIKERVGSVN